LTKRAGAQALALFLKEKPMQKEVDCILHGIAADHAADGFCVCGCTAL